MFEPLLSRTNVIRTEHNNPCPADGWMVAESGGLLHVHPKRRATPEEWTWVIAHGLLHLGFDHFQKRARQDLWNVACDAFVNRFLAELKIGRRPADIHAPEELPGSTENAIYDFLFERGVPVTLRDCGTAGPGGQDMELAQKPGWPRHWNADWPKLLAAGLRAAVVGAVDVAAGVAPTLGAARTSTSPAIRARSWFIANYPLLGALAAAFELIEDAKVCKSMEISVAAVDAEAREVYINPLAGLDEMESRFVMAHELLHVGLRHQARRQGRDPYLWNVACDYVINGWLMEMGVGQAPRLGLLHDPELKGLSAEAIYDRITADLRRYRKLMTLRGVGACDMLPGRPEWWEMGQGMELDAFYRRCLSQGLLYHQDQCRGLLPTGLQEEIRALDQPPIPWDVELAQWFDHHFPPRERRRSYARPSRRQASTPDIPRPRYVPVEDDAVCTFGVVLDTSGSMDRKLLAKAMGAIASYSLSRDVEAVRLIFCDAAPYDEGYVRPEDIAGRVKVKGRGGMVLQPGIDLLEKALDFPKDGPLLVITDGFCDVLRIRREHAFLIPAGAGLPFPPRGPVFRVR